MKTSTLLIATALAGSVVGTASAAGETGEIRQKVVSYQDLDLTDNDAARILYVRIKAAAREVCGRTGPLLVPIEMVGGIKACAASATARAVADVNAATLTSYHASQGGSPYDVIAPTAQVGENIKISARE